MADPTQADLMAAWNLVCALTEHLPPDGDVLSQAHDLVARVEADEHVSALNDAIDVAIGTVVMAQAERDRLYQEARAVVVAAEAASRLRPDSSTRLRARPSLLRGVAVHSAVHLLQALQNEGWSLRHVMEDQELRADVAGVMHDAHQIRLRAERVARGLRRG